MVKLFVGNLADSIDSHRLKNLFLQHVNVQECDVLKNFAFVHVGTDEDAQIVIDKLDNYKLEGREIHIERSTSRLRREPGMSDKCYTCGACDHKTPNCPKEPYTGRKRPSEEAEADELAKKSKPVVMHFPTPTPQQPNFLPFPQGVRVGGGCELDPELPCPNNPELHTLYEQYLESRTKYFFYRERLEKELKIQPGYVAPVPVPTDPNIPIHLGRVDLTKKVAPLGPIPNNYMGVQRIAPLNLSQYGYNNNSMAPIGPVNGYVSSITSSGGSFSTTHYNTVPAKPPNNLNNGVLAAGSPIKLGTPSIGSSPHANIAAIQAIPQFKVKMEVGAVPPATGIPSNLPSYNNYQASPQLR